MAFWIGAVEPEATEFPVLAMLRADLEKTGEVDRSAYPGLPIEDWITESARRVRVSKAAGAASAFLALKPAEMRLRKLDAAAHNRFRRGIRQISRGEAIVTDRLHVHICSLLIGRPHAVLDNSYGKIGRFMAAFSGGTELAYRASSLDDGLEWASGRANPAIAA
jgi:pyruvyl transferase EpsO